MVSKAAMTSEIVLGSANCTMIVPSIKYESHNPEARFDFKRSAVAWKEGNLELLEKTISDVMKRKSQEQLADALTDISPIIYVDCEQKGDNRILFAIMNKLIEKYPGIESEEIFMKSVKQVSMIEDNVKQNLPQEYAEFVKAYQSAFLHHLTLFDDREDKDDILPKIISFENDVAIRTIGKILRGNNDRAYVYLDHVKGLTMEEQQNINRILYTRGTIGTGDGVVFLKINDGLSSRQTWSTGTGQTAQATHDYSEYSIREEDL